MEEQYNLGDLFGKLIDSYTRSQAIEDGALVDVSDLAREAGIKIPVAITSSVWAMIEDIPHKYQGIQDVTGRLWDVLWMAACAARINPDSDTVFYILSLPRMETIRHVVKNNMSGNETVSQKSILVNEVRLKMVIGPGDQAEPVLTMESNYIFNAQEVRAAGGIKSLKKGGDAAELMRQTRRIIRSQMVGY